MRRLTHCTLFLIAATLVGAANSQEKKKSGKGSELDPKQKKPEPKTPRLSYSRKLTGTLYRFDSKTNKIFTFNVKVVDAKKVYDLNKWKQQTLVNIAKQRNIVERQKQILNYQRDLIKRQAGIYKDQGIELQAVDEVIVRTLFPPVVYDDKGNLKQWTKKDLIELRKKDKFPGFPAEYGVLRNGQPIHVYIAAPKKTKKKKGIPGIEKPVESLGPQHPKVVMIVVIQATAPK